MSELWLKTFSGVLICIIKLHFYLNSAMNGVIQIGPVKKTTIRNNEKVAVGDSCTSNIGIATRLWATLKQVKNEIKHFIHFVRLRKNENSVSKKSWNIK